MYSGLIFHFHSLCSDNKPASLRPNVPSTNNQFFETAGTFGTSYAHYRARRLKSSPLLGKYLV